MFADLGAAGEPGLNPARTRSFLTKDGVSLPSNNDRAVKCDISQSRRSRCVRTEEPVNGTTILRVRSGTIKEDRSERSETIGQRKALTRMKSATSHSARILVGASALAVTAIVLAGCSGS